MKKTTDFLPYLKIDKAAKYLTQEAKEEYTKATILELAQEGHLTISAVFPNSATTCKAQFIDFYAVNFNIPFNAESYSKDGMYLLGESLPEEIAPKCTTPQDQPSIGDEYATLGEYRELSSKKPYDLPLIGAERIEIQKALFPSSKIKNKYLEGTFVVDENDKYYCFVEWLDTKETIESTPTIGFNVEYEFVVRTEELKRWIKTLREVPPEKFIEEQIKKTDRNIIAVLLQKNYPLLDASEISDLLSISDSKVKSTRGSAGRQAIKRGKKTLEKQN